MATYRLKRLASIVAKVQRPEANFKLGELDDIGGCRLILETVEQVHQAADTLKARLILKGSDGEKNYIDTPRESGYRSYHLLTNNETPEGSYHIEIQIRTKLQHYWSTAVEAAGEIYGAEYKSMETNRVNDEQEAERLCFFKIVSSLFALEEHTSPVPGFTDNQHDLRAQLRSLDCAKQLLDDLQQATDSVLPIETKQNSDKELFLLKLSRSNQDLDIESYGQRQLLDAMSQYSVYEHRIEASLMGQESEECPYDNVVLVYARDSKQLEIAYPNYSTNVKQFIGIVRDYLS
ncbi:RelA/SpoT domain-containing protein [Bifidobacterium sp. DSM 109963]|uniref:RelA/SpoT domain-containing protein n=1 Tax=Bifidobacterium panos TaxID=2675321 RepID=A0ABX1SVX5_9BIFI|nr:RelA/SpoT domain-containing protein [Bifidobacterium sp. DSM 109963]